MLNFRFNDLSYLRVACFFCFFYSHSAMVCLEALAAPPAEVVWIEAFMDYIQTGMALEAKSIHREQREDHHEIFSRDLA